MNALNPSRRVASDREAGARCPHCNLQIALGEELAACDRCGAVHHVVCWRVHDGCGSFDCAPVRRTLAKDHQPALRISAEEVQKAVPLAKRPFVPAGFYPVPVPSMPDGSRRRRSRLAIAAFLVALAGIPLFGVVTGLVAILLGSLALGGIQQTRQRGAWLAVCGVLLGLADVVGWLMFLGVAMSSPSHSFSLSEFEPDAAALDHLSPRIARAVRANVLIETRVGGGILGGSEIGSGVILDIHGDSALIVTNRHVVNPNFSEDEAKSANNGLPDGHLQVKLIGQAVHPGRVVWIAPDGVDLALISVAVDGQGAQAAHWKAEQELMVGEDVFSIGNPQHLDWTHTRGSISQLRLQSRGNRKIHVIQTDAPLNPGNSGGGLYDMEGMLVGINTWTNDKRFSEGLGFAITVDSLLSLDPPPLQGQADHHGASDP